MADDNTPQQKLTTNDIEALEKNAKLESTNDNSLSCAYESTTNTTNDDTTEQDHAPAIKDEAPSTNESVWAEAWDDQSQAYYWWNTITYETTWDNPNASQPQKNELDSVLDTIDTEVRAKLDRHDDTTISTTPSTYPTYSHLGATDPYRFQAFFNTKTGRFQTAGGPRNPENYSIEARGRRQMEHYFDVEAYQAERNQHVEQGRKRALTKKEIERYKRAKKEKKMNRMREWLR
ncbi:hypothetical protein BC941DRAFT_423499, partial [Chlamydoabsidia padenii]